METILVDRRQVRAPHEVREHDKLEAIAASMAADGWRGRPLLVIREGDHYQAITGSHRTAAAGIADLDEIPVVVADAEAFFAEYPDAEIGRNRRLPWDDDDSKLAVFRALGDTAAVELIEAEIEANS